jgi:16S rRNA C967 or C1407 C5-methylase (RsmB/RsmF family)/NOL1/NOP2/fmu family ribosome biogenesis protein
MRELLREEAGAFFDALDGPSPASIRFNPLKPARDGELPFRELFDGQVPWCERGAYLRERPSFTLDPLLHGGAYYVQEASSMFLDHVLRQLLHGPSRVLDLCAAPGGKSTLGIGLLAGESLWVANEVVASRAAVLKENVIKWGSERVVVTRADSSRFAALPGAFDLVIVDAPCSGEGMFRREDGRAVSGWSEGATRACEARQRRIARDAWECVAPGGYLVYSTCTYNPGENERVLEWIARLDGACPVAISHDFAGIAPGDSPLPCYRFYPHRTRGEGFFTGALRKDDGPRFALPSRQERLPRVALPAGVEALVRGSGDHARYLAGETAGIVPRAHAGFIHHLERRVGVLYKGCEVAETGGKMAHALALWAGLPRERVETREVGLETATRFLRKEEVRLDVPRGEWAIVAYRSVALGWVKGVGGRVNNYYPVEWRVRLG